MGEKSDQIEKHIENTRNELGENLTELQEKVKSAVDWRAQFQERPMTMIGIAFGGGVLLSALIGGKSHSKSKSSSLDDSWSRPTNRESSSIPSSFASASGNFFEKAGMDRSKVSDAWENIKGALIGVAATKVRGYVEELVPGFEEHYRKVESNKGSSSFSSGSTSSKADGHSEWPESGKAFSAHS